MSGWRLGRSSVLPVSCVALHQLSGCLSDTRQRAPGTGRAAYSAGQLGGKRTLTFERGAEAQVDYSLQSGIAGP